MRGTFQFEFSKQDLAKFNANCEVAIRNLGRGTKHATTEACEEILARSLEQVPKLTTTLMQSAFYEVHRRGDVSGYSYEGTVGYGGNGDPVNPTTGQRASSYMVAVHENLSARHPIGKAKFLEDPIREYAENNFQRTVFKYAKESLASLSD